MFSAVALIGLTQAMAHSTVATTNTISSSQLVFSFIASVLLFSEVGSPAMILGVVLVMGGIIVAQVDRSRAARASGCAGGGSRGGRAGRPAC